MSTLFIFIFLLSTIILALIRFKKCCFLSGILTVIIFIAVGNGFFPAYLLRYLQIYKEYTIDWKKNNTIVVLGAGTSKVEGSIITRPSLMSFSRITVAAGLYHDCKKRSATCRILISGGDPLHNGKTEAATYRNTLITLGINQADIQLEVHSKNTFQNAEFASVMLMQYPARQILLVSSGLTLKRALLYFSYFNVHPIPIPSDLITIRLSKFPLGYNLAMNDFAVHEIIGIARFYIYNFLGWNKKSLANYYLSQLKT